MGRWWHPAVVSTAEQAEEVTGMDRIDITTLPASSGFAVGQADDGRLVVIRYRDQSGWGGMIFLALWTGACVLATRKYRP